MYANGCCCHDQLCLTPGLAFVITSKSRSPAREYQQFPIGHNPSPGSCTCQGVLCPDLLQSWYLPTGTVSSPGWLTCILALSLANGCGSLAQPGLPQLIPNASWWVLHPCLDQTAPVSALTLTNRSCSPTQESPRFSDQDNSCAGSCTCQQVLWPSLRCPPSSLSIQY